MALNIDEKKLKLLMKRSGIKTQTELARRTGLARESLNRLIKNRRRSMDGETINRLCGVLNAQPGEFLYYTPDPLEG